MSLLKGLPVEHYSCIVADPPWSFATWSEKNQTRAPKYDVMSLDDINALPVRHLAADDALLFLWVTNPMLEHGLNTLRNWGFDYSTVAFTWAKTTRSSEPTWAPKWHFGMGYWTRANVELVLLGVRGKPKRIDKGVRQLITAPVREHSRKPDEVYSSIERLCDGPRLELFGRQSRPGWEVRGNQATMFDTAAQEAPPEEVAPTLAPESEIAQTARAASLTLAPSGPNAVSLLHKLRSGMRPMRIPRLDSDALHDPEERPAE